MLQSISSFVFIVLALLFSPALHTQQVTNFSGTWILDTAKCDPGPGGYLMDKDRILKITQNAASITFATTYPSSGDFLVTNKFLFDGKEKTEKRDYGVTRTTVSWSTDKKVLTIKTVTTADTKNGPDDFLVSDSWKLSDDGRRLVNESFSENKQLGKAKYVMAYKKK